MPRGMDDDLANSISKFLRVSDMPFSRRCGVKIDSDALNTA